MKVQGSCLQAFLGLLLAGLPVLAAPPAAAQSLLLKRLPNGTELVVVAQPMAEVTTVAWPQTADPGNAAAGSSGSASITSGGMTLVVDLEEAIGSEAGPAPPVVIAVGGAAAADLERALARLLAERPAEIIPARPARRVDEGRIERRLGAAGSEAELRLEINLPPPSDPQRTPLEVLWDLLPELVDRDLAGLRTRVDGDIGVLEVRVDPTRADMSADRLRFAITRVAEAPQLDEQQVGAAVRRMVVRRRALLERHPEAAVGLLELWRDGGTDAVREFLFAAESMTPVVVRDAARAWLPRHPGTLVVLLPPHAINPRFAEPPAAVELEGGPAISILERPGTPLAAVCLRPVVVPDLDGETAAAILTRVASELRTGPRRPGWVRVETEPPELEIAGPPDGFAELLEALRGAVAEVAEDRRPIAFSDGDARRRALRLMAGVLGAAEGAELSPATLLRADNLGLGVVAPDGESAAEAVRKFWSVGGADRSPVVRPLAVAPRTREAVAGSSSTMVIAVPLPVSRNEAVAPVVGELLASRGRKLWGDRVVEIIAPFIPGRPCLLLLVSRAGRLDELEKAVRSAWPELTRAVAEDELAAVRRRVASLEATRWSGTTGRARRCAAVAAGAAWWRPAAELEMAILSLPPDAVNAVLEAASDWQLLESTGAGVLPMVDAGARAATSD